MRHSLAAPLLLVLCGTAAAQVTIPHNFTTGTAARASEVNNNFQALANAINEGIRGYEIVRQTHTSTAQTSGPAPVFTATCPAGKRVLGGGFSGQNLGAPGANGGVPAVIALSSQPGGAAGQPTDTRWEVQVFNNTTANQTIVVSAICARAVTNN